MRRASSRQEEKIQRLDLLFNGWMGLGDGSSRKPLSGRTSSRRLSGARRGSGLHRRHPLEIRKGSNGFKTHLKIKRKSRLTHQREGRRKAPRRRAADLDAGDTTGWVSRHREHLRGGLVETLALSHLLHKQTEFGLSCFFLCLLWRGKRRRRVAAA